MSRGWSAVVALAVAVTSASAVPAAAEPFPGGGSPPELTDLVLLLDGSGSIDAADWRLQLDGYAAALRDTVNFPVDGSVAVSVVQWSADGSQPETRTEIPLTVLKDAAGVEGVVAKVLAVSQIGASTNPGDALRTGTDELLARGRAGADWALCMSTDGSQNSGESMFTAQQYARTNGVDRYSVVAIEDPPSFRSSQAHASYDPYVFGGGAVTVARTTTEFTSLISGCAAEPMQLRALEVNQSVQDWDNSLPLVAFKPTVVRAFLQTPDGEQVRTSGRLRGVRNGVELPGSPLTAVNGGTGVVVDGLAVDDRSDLADTLNFALPASWTQQGVVSLDLELPGGVFCRDPGTAVETSCTEVVLFDPPWEMDVAYRALEWEQDGSTVGASFATMAEQHRRTVSMLPTSGWSASYSTIRVDDRPDDNGDVNERLHAARELAEAPSEQRWYGVLSDGTTSDGGGLSSGRVAMGWTGGLDGQLRTGHARNRAPHEIGHSNGLHHSVNAAQNGYTKILWVFDDLKRGWCGEVADGDASDYPDWIDAAGDRRAALGPMGDAQTEVWGLDTDLVGVDDDLAVSAPQTTYSLMSYCVGAGDGQGRWIGQRDYRQLHGGDREPISGDEAARAAGDGILFRGTVRADGAAAELRPALAAHLAATPSLASGTHELVLLDAAGAVLHSTRFTPTASHGEPAPGTADTAGDDAVFSVVAPASVGGAARVQLRQVSTGAVVASATASASTPTTAVPAPTTGTADRVDLTWRSTDADGDALRHTVLYSPDGGASWDVVAMDVSGTSVSVPRRSLPGSAAARVKVVVSDGVRTSAAVSPSFALPNLAPTVTIASPADGATVTGAQSVVLEASVDDAEDGTLAPASVQWRSDRDGALGEGARLLRRADTLSEGVHTLTVRATDSGGAGTERSVRLTVRRIAAPPPPPPASTYAFGGFTPPVSGTELNVVNAGRTIPVKWTVTGTGVDDATVTAAAFDEDGATYAMERTGSTWHLNVQTPKAWVGTTRVLQVRLADGTVHTARFSFR